MIAIPADLRRRPIFFYQLRKQSYCLCFFFAIYLQSAAALAFCTSSFGNL
jgi:hypothetical protein